tara:strand:- start:986 stop:1132 length:147 start_codon:yes stop_codon:yes gene_type:complete
MEEPEIINVLSPEETQKITDRWEKELGLKHSYPRADKTTWKDHAELSV